MKLFSAENLLNLLREAIWWVLTACVTYAVLFRIDSQLYYLYYGIHAAFIFVAITYFRWSISFRSVAILRPSWLRFLLFTLNLVLFIYFTNYLLTLIGKLDNYFLEDFGFPKVIMYEEVRASLFQYMSVSIVLSGTACLVLIIAFQLRLVVSYWQLYKHQATRMLED